MSEISIEIIIVNVIINYFQSIFFSSFSFAAFISDYVYVLMLR